MSWIKQMRLDDDLFSILRGSVHPKSSIFHKNDYYDDHCDNNIQIRARERWKQTEEQKRKKFDATIAQWICMCLPSFQPRFESQAHHLCFPSIYRQICSTYTNLSLHCEKAENKQREAEFGPYLKETKKNEIKNSNTYPQEY